MAAALAPGELLKILDAIYDVGQPPSTWFGNLLSTLCAASNLGAGVGGVLYETLSASQLRIDAIQGIDMPPGWREVGAEMHQNPTLAPRIIASYRAVQCATLPEMNRRLTAPARRQYVDHQVGGQIMLNGLNCDGKGCAVFLFSRGATLLSAESRDFYSRLATHLATGYRLHLKMANAAVQPHGAVEAIFAPDGKPEHLMPRAQTPEALRALQTSLRKRERAKRLPHAQASRALGLSRALVDARWSLVDGSAALIAQAYIDSACGLAPNAVDLVAE
ncbi:MAG: hypothetical protein M3Y32_08250, partial [Pseudomonadota bacterium]|nr:hypothetical protein [Pseudomonadota bacterium]